jgi:hypothetical protein
MEDDFFKRLGVMYQYGFEVDPLTLRFTKKAGGIVPATPWCHAKGSHWFSCQFDHHIAFNLFGIIAPRCQSCWKVCMGLPNFASLMEMEEMQKQLPFPCKCGIERREYTPKHYGAYFYTNSLRAGRERYNDVVELVTKNMTKGKKIAKGIILKRGCTEYEMIKGPSPYWRMTEKEKEIYSLLEAYVDIPRNNHDQYEAIKINVKQDWIKWAHSHGDYSYLPWNGGEKLFPDYVSYHKGDIEGIEADMAKAVEAGRQEEIEALKESSEQSIEEPVEYPKETIGEQDELT